MVFWTPLLDHPLKRAYYRHCGEPKIVILGVSKKWFLDPLLDHPLKRAYYRHCGGPKIVILGVQKVVKGVKAGQPPKMSFRPHFGQKSGFLPFLDDFSK